MHILQVLFTGLCLLLSVSSVVSASSLMIIAYEQSDKTALIPEAIVYSDGVISGKTDIHGEYNLSYEGDPPVIRVAKGGYTDWTGSPSINDTALLVPMGIRNSSLNVEVYDADTLSPVQGSQILVTGEDGLTQEGRTGADGRSSIPLKADQVYNVRVQTRDFQPVNDTVVTTTDNTTVQYSLVRNDRISLRVTNSVSGQPIQTASISIDGQAAGITNDHGILITNTSKNQEHVFEIKANGYVPEKQTRVIADLDKLIDFPLTEAKSVVFVSVYDGDNRPLSGADISVDGRAFGVTNEYGRLMIPGLEMKMHEFSASMEGYSNASLSKPAGEETGEVILVLNKDLKNLLINVRDQEGNPLSNATVSLTEDISQKKTDKVSNPDGTAIFPVDKRAVPSIIATLQGYYSNSTTVPSGLDNFTIVLASEKNATVNDVQEQDLTPEFPIIPLVVVILLLLLVIGGVVIIKKRPNSRRKRRNSRRRSL